VSYPPRPEWAVIRKMRKGTVKMFPHDHDPATSGVKCATHQTLAGNAPVYGLDIHVFHDRKQRLWVARMG